MGAVDLIPVVIDDLANSSGRARRGFQVEVDRVTESEWSTWMDHFDDANIYQTWAYGAVRWREKNLSHLILRDGDDVVGMAQLRIVRPAGLPVGVAYLRWGPLCHRSGSDLDRDLVRTIAEALRNEYVKKRGLYLEVLPNAFGGTRRAELFESEFYGFDRRPGLSREEYRTFLLDISPPLEDLRKNLDKKWRNQLNASARNNLEVVEGSDTAHYGEFSALYEQMWQRKKFDSAVSVDEFQAIQERLPDRQKLRIFICRLEGKPVSGLVCSALGQNAIYLLGATNEEGMKVKASYLLQWTAIQSAKERGCRSYDLGGIDPLANPGVHHFKSGLSGADASHVRALTSCDSPISAGLVKVGQFARDKFRALRHRTRQRRSEEFSR